MCIDIGVLLGFVIVLAAYVAFHKLRDPLRCIPGPSGLPFFGQALSINFSAFHLQLDEWRRIYGPVTRITLMGRDIVILSGIDVVREALLTRGTDFAGRPTSYRAQRVTYGKSIAFQNFSKKFVAQKKMALKALRPFGDGMIRIESIVGEAAREFIDEIGSKNGAPFDIEKETSAFVCNVMTTLLYGERIALDDPIVERMSEMNRSILAAIDPTAPGRELDAMPWLRYTFLSRRGVELLKKAERMRDEILKVKLKEAKATLDPERPRGCLDQFLLAQARDRDEEGRLMWDAEHMTALGITFITAGMLTTSSALSATYLLLLHHKNAQEKIQNEIDSVVGRARAPQLNDFDAMPYTQAFVFETLRYISIVPVSSPKLTLADTSVGGYFIPANTRVFINNWSVHHDENVYPQPFKFCPERFLDQRGALLQHDHPIRTSFIAFGLGRRICIGEHLARTRLLLLVTSLLQRFTLVEDETRPLADPDPRRFSMGLVLDPPKCSLRAVARF